MEKKVLLVEDDSGMRNMLTLYLKKKGYYVVEAKDGKEGIALLSQEDFPIVITDLKMPGADGISVLKAAKKKDVRTRVIIITAYASLDTAVEALKLGAYEYVIKPIEDLERDIGRIIDRAFQGILLSEENQRLLQDLKKRQKDMELELDMASRVQESLLPSHPSISGLDIGIWRENSGKISGHFFDIIPYGKGCTGFIIGQVLGRDMPAALLMAAICGTSRSILRDMVLPSRFLSLANESIYHILSKGFGNFISLLYAIIDIPARRIICASAGRMSFLIIRREKKDEYKSEHFSLSGSFLGKYKKSEFDEKEFKIKPSDRFIFFTNTLPELQGRDGESVGIERLEEYFINTRELSPKMTVERLKPMLIKYGVGESDIDFSLIVADIR